MKNTKTTEEIIQLLKRENDLSDSLDEKCVNAWDDARDKYFEFVEEAIKEAYKRLADYPNNYKIDIFEIEDNDLIDGFFELSGIAQRCFYDIEDKGKKIVKTVWGWEFDEYDEDGEKNDLDDVIDLMMEQIHLQ